MRRFAQLFVALLVVASVNGATIQTRLIRASNEAGTTDPQLKELEAKLRGQFGYKHYHELGAKAGPLKDKTAQAFKLGEGFAVTVTPLSVEKKVHELTLDWMSGNTSLVKSTVKIAHGGHLFVKGPEVGNDWIILSLSVRD